MVRRRLAFGALACSVACGGTTIGAGDAKEAGPDIGDDEASADAGGDADADADATDTAWLSCGDAQCGPSQICLYPPCGCAREAGPCAPPSCASPPPGSISLDCSGEEAGAECDNVSVPVPSDCNRTCRSICF
jgi:hypothetical protein